MTALSDRALLERICCQLDHLNQMAHEQRQEHAELLAQLAPLLPHIPRALALLDPGASMRKLWRPKNAVPKPETAPVHVGEAPEDRPPMGA